MKYEETLVAAESAWENAGAELVIEELEERSALEVHGACACTCSCGCSSTSCVAWAS